MFPLITSSMGLFAAILLAVLLFVSFRRSPGFYPLALSLLLCTAIELFDLITLLDAEALLTWRRFGFLCESLLVPVWLVFGLQFCGYTSFSLIPWWNRLLLVFSPVFFLTVLLVPVEQAFFNPDFVQEQVLFLGRTSYFFYLGLLFYLTCVLVMLERGYAARDSGTRWQVKMEIVGLIAIIAAQFFFYSQALLYRSLDFSLLPVRSLALALGCGMIAYSRFRRGTPQRIRISREVTYRSVVVLVVGFYLFGLGLVGEGMRYFGEHSQRYILGLFALFGGIAVLLLMLSGTHRRRLRVLINKNFFKEKYDYRSHWIDFSCRLALANSLHSVAKSVLGFFAETFSVRGGALYVLSGDRKQFEALAATNHSVPKEKLNIDSPLVNFLQESGWVFNREDEQSEILQAHQHLFSAARFCFAIPLYVGDRIEAILLLGNRIDPREKVNYEDYDLMKTLAVQTMAALQNYRLGEQLSNSREMAAIGRVSTFVMHDLKNLVSNLALVVENAKDHLDDPEFQQDMLDTLDGSVSRMKGLIDRLQNIGTGPVLNLKPTDLRTLAVELLAEFGGSDVRLSGESVTAVVDRVEIRKVLLNLLMNAEQASSPGIPIELEIHQNPRPSFVIRDHGCGMTEEFMRERLFHPFETTKKKGFGVGLYQCKQVIEAHGGEIEIQSQQGEGTEVRVAFEEGDISTVKFASHQEPQEEGLSLKEEWG